jgi:hypothetical protein
MLGGAVLTGLLTLVLVGVAATGGGTAPVQTQATSQVATTPPAAATTTASPAAASAVVVASPAAGSPVFVGFTNPLAEVVITGFLAPPPGTHLSHVSTFRMQATGTALVYLWTLTNPVCGSLSGAQARTASVTWDHGACGTLESAARISVTVARATDLGPDGTPNATAPYFTYAQTARAGDSFATDPLPKNASLQYFGPPPATVAPAPVTSAPVVASPAAPAPRGGSSVPWAPAAAALSAIACAFCVWRSRLVSAARG